MQITRWFQKLLYSPILVHLIVIRRELAWIAASAWGADQAYERVREWDNRRPMLSVDNP
jgi:hypothetical protein